MSKRDGMDASLTRRGDMSVSMEGNLVNGQGAVILSETLQPIQVPPFRKLIVAEDGKLLIEPMNGEPGVTQLIGSIGLVSGEGVQLRKDDDGEIRPADGSQIVTDQNVNVKQGYIEESNVNVIDELVASMGYQRSYEMNMKLIKMASDLDQVQHPCSECRTAKSGWSFPLLNFNFLLFGVRILTFANWHKACKTSVAGDFRAQHRI